ncbi:unannotated protein [freshwater metagenome]|uniref:Unannotated protein n=1 Tax=freshwater metagenome TaxID=449393 RepID=A0A6J7VX92_9ZZZZ
MSTSAPQRLIDNMRNVRYGEVLAVFARDNKLEAEVYGTQMINDCPDELWKTLDAAAIASEMSALAVKLNGPRYWVLDGLGTKVAFVEPVMRDFNGLMMRRIATVDLGDKPATVPYEERYVNRGAVFFFDAGSVVYELINPQGKAYVMQAYCVGVDPTLNLDNLSDLANRLDLPTGWTFRSRILDAELVVDTTDHPATVVQDEFENTYTLPY